jgi:hypothetical protein
MNLEIKRFLTIYLKILEKLVVILIRRLLQRTIKLSLVKFQKIQTNFQTHPRLYLEKEGIHLETKEI